MIRLSDVLHEIIIGNPLLQLGLQQRLLNLSQLARYIKPQVEARSKKSVKPSAILMALSRLQRQMEKKSIKRSRFHIENIAVQTGLHTYTFTNSPEVHRGVHKLYMAVEKKGGFMTVSEGVNQMTIIVESEFAPLLRSFVSARPLYRHTNISSLGVMFDKKYTTGVPGFIYIVLQQLMLQKINLIEVSSTFTELILYLDEKDTKVAFDTLYGLFHA